MKSVQGERVTKQIGKILIVGEPRWMVYGSSFKQFGWPSEGLKLFQNKVKRNTQEYQWDGI